MNGGLQHSLIGNLLAGGETCRRTRQFIVQHGFKPEYVGDPELRTCYDILMAEKSDDNVFLIKAVQGKASQDKLEECVNRANENLIDVERTVIEVKDAGEKAKIMEIVNAAMRQNATNGVVAADISSKLGEFQRSIVSTAATGGYSLDEIGEPIPEEDDPDCLFAGGFLLKGGALVMASVSGSGKSTLLMQFAFAWAIGREMFGIRPIRSMRIGIFQAENEKQDLRLFNRDIQEGLRRVHGYDEDDLKQAKANIRFFDPQGKSGDEFLAMVRAEQQAGRFDLIVIDPLNAVTDFDISDNTKMNEYLCKKIDPIIKHDAATKCALMLVHHTNKPSAQLRGGFGGDQYAQYVGAGAAKLTNWMRAMLAVMPTDENGVYRLIAAKRGERLGWPQLAGKKYAKPTRLIRHATPEEGGIFWHEASGNDEGRGGSPSRPTKETDAARLAAILQTDAKTLTEARNCAKEMFGRKRGDAAYDELFNHLSDNNVVIKPTGKASQSIIGSEKSVKKYFSTLQEKEAAALRQKLAKLEEGK